MLWILCSFAAFTTKRHKIHHQNRKSNFMQPVFLHDKLEVEAYLRRDPYLHLYALGDLDDFFWPYTTWLACREGQRVEALMLLYSGGGLPVLLALANEGLAHLRALLQASLPLLPRRFYSHLTPGLVETAAAGGCRLEPHGRYLKMRLGGFDKLVQVDTAATEQFNSGDEAALKQFYAASYPGNWFDPRMLETGCYYGIRQGGEIVSVAGIHVYSPRYRAAALGNITTHPDYRGRGLGKAVTARLCQELCKTVDHIGLNVRADNAAAVSAYTRLGFAPYAEYEEYMIESG
jgi:GNAT superfamily N-acetyltransferase